MNKTWKTIKPKNYKNINTVLKVLKEKNTTLVFGLKI